MNITKQVTLIILASMCTAMVPLSCFCQPQAVENVQKPEMTRMKADELLQNINNFNQKNIIFDMTGVLFNPSRAFIASEIGWGYLALYAIRHLKNPFDFIKVLLDFLEKVSPSTEDKFYKGRKVPKIIEQWQNGEKSGPQLLAEVKTALDTFDQQGYFASSIEKYVISVAAQSLLTPEILAEKSFHPLDSGITLLQAFAQKMDAQGNQAHDIYLLSNFDKDTFPLLVKKYPDVFKHFKGMVISGDVGAMKPDKKMYECLLQTYNLDPKNCFFIDDQEENIEAGEKFGIKSVQFLE